LGKLKIVDYVRQGKWATSFAMACNLLGRYVHQNGAAAADLGLGSEKVSGRLGIRE
jgi:jasmonate ZIM domain-containing protein